MSPPALQVATLPGSHGARRGFTLVELMASMTIMAMLAGAMMSAIFIASRAIPDGQSPIEKKNQAINVVDRIAGEFYYATSITKESANAVSLTVADREHGAEGPETIRYEWSGSPGAPLTRQYNGGTVVTLCDQVEDFSLAFSYRATELQGMPRVLLVVDNTTPPPLSQDDAKRTMIESWGFTVEFVAASAQPATFLAGAAITDVMYISNQVNKNEMADKSLNPTQGIVDELSDLHADIGFSVGTTWVTGYQITVSDAGHEITAGLPLAILDICMSDQTLSSVGGALAPDLRHLATNSSEPALAIIEVGGRLFGGDTARGRRVKLPWGREPGFDFNSLTADGLTLMKRAIVWAAAPVVYSSARITIQTGADPTTRIEKQTQILNRPKAGSS